MRNEQFLVATTSEALSADKLADPTVAAIDLSHLRRYTLGNSKLEQEILGLFAEHAAGALSRLAMAEDEMTRRQEAHALKGSALAVGAWPIAELAQRAEASAGDAEGMIDVLAQLAVAVGRAKDFVCWLKETLQA